MKNLSIFVFSIIAILSTAEAGILSKEEFVGKCLQQITLDGRISDEYQCIAKSQKDADLLDSVGIDERFEIKTSKAQVGMWGDGVNKYHSEVAFVLKGGFFGFNAKVLRINCVETKKGIASLRSPKITVDIQDHIDSRTTAEVECR